MMRTRPHYSIRPAAVGAALLAAGCGGSRRPAPAPAVPAVRFTDVTREAGITFVHNNGARGKKYFPETCGSGCAFLDYDRDGSLDLLLVNSMDWPGAKGPKPSRMALYRGNGRGSFTETTAAAGLDVPMYGIGCAVGDYDNDGFPDLYVTAALGPSRLFHNRGGRFEEVTETAGVDNEKRWGSSAAWLDYDGDGRLDLFVGNYIRWTPATDLACHSIRPGVKSYCTPEAYRGESCRLYRNIGGGTFRDVTRAAGVHNPNGKSLAVVASDLDADGWTDLIVANDTQPNYLYHNLRGRFEEVGLEQGIAFGDQGKPRAGMGVDVAEPENDGRTCILVNNFSGEGNGYFRRQESGDFVDAAAECGMVPTSLQFLGWGAAFLDADLDGWQDAFLLNGHIDPDIQDALPTITYAERPLLFRQAARGRYEEVGEAAGLNSRYVGRGLAVGDYDNDGDPDLLVAENHGPAHLLRNDTPPGRHWVRLRLEGSRSNRSAIGAKITVRAGGIEHTAYVKNGGSYASHSDDRLLIGLGSAVEIEELTVRWPSGAVTRLRSVPVDRQHDLMEKDAAAPGAAVGRGPGRRDGAS
jgi:hypothetical protein